nr:unnamed protein product [Spirometra erinaceieuropaei]
MSEHGVDVEDSRPLQYIRVRDPVLSPRLHYSSRTVEMEVFESLRLLLVYRPGPRSVQQSRQDDRFVNLHFGVEVETVAISDCHFVVDLFGAVESAAQAEVVAGGGKEIHAPLHLPFRGGVECAAFGRCGYTRLEVHPSAVYELAVRRVGDADSGTFVTVGVQQYGSEHETKEEMDKFVVLEVLQYFSLAVLHAEQVADDGVVVTELVLMPMSCVTEDSQGCRLDRVLQWTPSVLRGGVLVVGGGGGDDGLTVS